MTPNERRKLWYNMLEADAPFVEERISEGIEKIAKANSE